MTSAFSIDLSGSTRSAGDGASFIFHGMGRAFVTGMSRTYFVLVHPLTRLRLPIPFVFESMSEAVLFAIQCDYDADAVPIAHAGSTRDASGGP